jgi:L-malate glycosyltransferase
MKICYLADAGNIHTKKWMEFFQQEGHEIYIISSNTFDDSDLKSSNGKENSAYSFFLLKSIKVRIPVITYVGNIFYRAWQVRKILKKVKPDLVHAHFISSYGVWGALAACHPFIISAWGSDILIDLGQNPVLKRLVVHALAVADLITCDGENVIDEMIRVGAKPEKMVLIRHGVDVRRFCPAKKDDRLRSKWAGSAGSPVIISTRRLFPLYNIDTLINAIPAVLKEHKDAKFIIVGIGPEDSDLKRLADTLGVAGHVLFTGWVPNDALPGYLASSDIYVSTALSDGGIAISTIEAMACGLIPIVTDNADNKKWIEDGVNGFIVPVKDQERLAEKIIYSIKNLSLKDDISNKNLTIINEKSNYELEMKKVEELYERSLLRV